MAQNIFNPMELDAIGEIMNISLGSSATAVSNMLDHRVDITTPSVDVVSVDDFSIGDLEPAIGVEIRYVSGLEGSNIMLLKKSDVKVIVDILMGSETPEEEFELNDLTVSAVCEVMNQMMGAASTALSDFLGHPVNISTPQSFALDDMDKFKKEHFAAEGDTLVVVRFMLSIEDILKSEFVNVMSVDLARELLAGFEMNFGSVSSEEDSAAKAAPAKAEPQPAPAPQPAAPSAAQSGPGPVMSQEEIEQMLNHLIDQPQEQQTPPPAPPGPGAAAGRASGSGPAGPRAAPRGRARLAGPRAQAHQRHAPSAAHPGRGGPDWQGAGGQPGAYHVRPAGNLRGDWPDPAEGGGYPLLLQGVSGGAGQAGRRPGGPVCQRPVRGPGRRGGHRRQLRRAHHRGTQAQRAFEIDLTPQRTAGPAGRTIKTVKGEHHG